MNLITAGGTPGPFILARVRNALDRYWFRVTSLFIAFGIRKANQKQRTSSHVTSVRFRLF